MSFLRKVREFKEDEVLSLKLSVFGEREGPVYDPKASLSEKPVIAEVKMASPSCGLIKEVDAFERARLYEEAGAGAVSVLVDERFFKGGWEKLRQAASAVKVPVLCKEFVLSEKQIDAAYRCGADFVLFIYGFVEDRRLEELMGYAKKKGLYTLLEIFDEDHIDGALRLKFVDMMGVNSRNLEDLSVSVERAVSIMRRLPSDLFKVAESGIKDLGHVKLFLEAGARAFLIGEALMRAEDPASFIRRINSVCEGMWS